MAEPTIQVFDSRGEAYHRAFQVFLDHTDQKVKAKAWLDRLVGSLPARRVLIDAGAGNGQVTAWYTPAFEKTIAIEPNASLREELQKVCPQADVQGTGILDGRPSALGDLVLCSHVFYYIDLGQWLAHLEKLASWLAEKGTLVVVLQNHETDCMRMLDHFLHRRFDLAKLADEFRAAHGQRYDVRRETVAAWITTQDFAPAITIAEFMLNLVPIEQAPARKPVEEYVRQHFADAKGGFRFSCHQDMLVVR